MEADQWNTFNNRIVSARTLGNFKRRLNKLMDQNDRWKETELFTEGLPTTNESNGLLQLPSFSYILMSNAFDKVLH